MASRTACFYITCHDDSAASGAAVEVKVTMTPHPSPGERSIVGLVAVALYQILQSGGLRQKGPAPAPPAQGVAH